MMFNNLDVEAYDRQYSDRELIRRALAYFAPHRARMVRVIAGTLLVAALSAGVPIMLKVAMGRFEVAGAAAVPRGVIAVLVGYLFVSWVAIWFGNFVRRRAMVAAIGDVVLTLRRDAFAAAAAHDLSFFDRFSSGRIVSRITSDTTDFGQSVALVGDLVSQVGEVAILLAVAATYSWRMTLWTLGTVPTLIAFTLTFRALARRVTRQGARAMGEVNAKTFETVAGMAVAKNFRREQTVYDEFRAVNEISYRLNFRRGFTLAMVFPVLNLIMGGFVALIVWRGALAAGQGALALSAWFLFSQLIDRIGFPIINLSTFWTQVQVGFAAIERICALVDAEPSVVQTGSEPVERVAGDVRFEHVRFAYASGEGAGEVGELVGVADDDVAADDAEAGALDADAPHDDAAAADTIVLPDFSLHIRAGESIALVGHTGAGKSSVARLVARFYEFQGGRLLIDGRDIRSFDLGAFRRHLGIVPQMPFLFNGTVADNIRYARPEATDDEIERLARSIGDGDWLAALPDGLATDVGERGDRLSVGQRQLVSLMRVLIQRPAIFILDEATASIDPFTEAQIQEALERLIADRTSIVIAHRLSTVRAADRILVMDRGRIIEEGDHDALMRAGGHYARLYDTYFRHQSLDYVVQETMEESAEDTAKETVEAV
ncbi:MAG: ABC transporter ATP-binding protein [Ardenticatenales bacterium]